MLCLGLAFGVVDLGCVVPDGSGAAWHCGQAGDVVAEGTQCEVTLVGCSTTLLQSCLSAAWVGPNLTCPTAVHRRLGDDDDGDGDDENDEDSDDTDDDDDQEIADLMAPGLCACWQSKNGLPDFPGCLPCVETQRDGWVERTRGCQAALGPRRCDAARYCGLEGIPGCGATPEPTTPLPPKDPSQPHRGKCNLQLIEGSAHCQRPRHYGCHKKGTFWVRQGCSGLFTCNGIRRKCSGDLPGKTVCRCYEGPSHGHSPVGPPPPPPPPPPPRDEPAWGPEGFRGHKPRAGPAFGPDGPRAGRQPHHGWGPDHERHWHHGPHGWGRRGHPVLWALVALGLCGGVFLARRWWCRRRTSW